MTPLQANTVTVLAAMEQVGMPDEQQVETLCSALAALCCARAKTPADLRGLVRTCTDDINNRAFDAWRTADPILKGIQK